ncbi:hypothetical protein C2134_02810 [Chromobacterium sinusclupearum]|uniref:Uncharacterized protein n=1 Tax=Chromobacterium sinusclupearum TaxID=2077146 RepID=A0A2K4MSQ0_9NEIS|nr:hypothetical protein [Chromobacterium sinusclupearum]POB00139.1 hypothetical protein C2134_02810 [Chromobacterium sinusclupearum]
MTPTISTPPRHAIPPLAGMAELLASCRISNPATDQLSEMQKLIYQGMQPRKHYSFQQLLDLTGGKLNASQGRRVVRKLMLLHMISTRRTGDRINSPAVYWRSQ